MTRLVTDTDLVVGEAVAGGGIAIDETSVFFTDRGDGRAAKGTRGGTVFKMAR
jgi:hypothetical protein